MKRIRVFLVQMPGTLRSTVLAAAREAFPAAQVIETGSVEEAEGAEATHHPDLLVLANPGAASAAIATQAIGATGLPRWAVVILDRDISDLAETVPPEEWNRQLLARVFRSELLQHELLCENLRLRGDLKTVARRVSHDLRTPVGCIYTSAQVLGILPAGDTQTTAAMLRAIENSSTEITQIINRVSFVLKASADPCFATRVEMGGVVAAVLSQLEPELQQSGAKVTQPSSWPEVAGVSQWLQVIWWNLLSNAVKHGGPALQVRTAWCPDNDGYRFSVTDSGAGTAPASATGLFSPFEQLHTLLIPGLGLSIVQRLVGLQGGRCGYEKLPEGGACFYFTLPAPT